MSNPKITMSALDDIMPTLLAAPKWQPLGLVSAPAVGKTQYFQTRMVELFAESRGISTDKVGLIIEKVGQREDAAAVCGLTLPSKDANGNLVTTGSKPYLIQRIEQTGLDYGIILLDELLQANADIQKALADLLNADERKIGDWPIPDGWIVVFTGNRAQDKSGAVRMLSHLRAGRAIVFELVFDKHGWKRWAEANGGNPLLIDCAMSHHDFFEDSVPSEDRPYCTPRSAVRASDHLNAFMNSEAYDGGQLPEYIETLLAANIGADKASRLNSFIAMADKVPTGAEICRDPHGANVPDETGYQQLAGSRAVGYAYDAASGEAALEYIIRLRADLVITLGTKLMQISAKRGWALSSDTAVAFNAKYSDLIPLAYEG